MKILTMTATFGKLSGQTLTLQPDMNIVEAPNEWGKSTWCAFLLAMLYGIDTAARSKTGFLAEKEHYAPWSGEPMSGSMTFMWKGRQITLERQSKGRTPLGEVRAFETQTGVPVPELEVAAPGQVLLGVERSVFARAGFLRLSEMPVTEDESLRRRLNELVTTGDESGASDVLAQKLRDLKNKCRFNKKGLIPEAETKLAEIQQKLQQLESLKYQISSLTQRQQTLEEENRLLENHKQALAYQEQAQYAQKLTLAQVNLDTAMQNLQNAQLDCKDIPQPEEIQQALAQLQQLRDIRDALHTKAQLLPPLPPAPESTDAFRGKTPEQAVSDAKLDIKVLQQLRNDRKKPVPYIFGGLLVAVGVVMLVLSQPIPTGVFLALGVVCAGLGILKQKKLRQQIARLLDKYRGIREDCILQEAERYAAAQKNYGESLSDRQQLLAEMDLQMEENARAIAAITGGQSLFQYEEVCRSQLQRHTVLQERQRNLRQAEEVLQTLSGAGKQVLPPQFADTLTLTAQQTQDRLTENTFEQQLLHQKLGQCQGQMDALGQEEALLTESRQIQNRIAHLEQYYRALTLAQETLQQATQELQRRFAPRISQRAQELFARLTGQRYQRLNLCQDLSLEASAQGENTLKGTLWRSDGTVDQLYLALRLAVAEELTPEAPLVLDDALVRFDDRRLAVALEILKEESEHKQVILFTCQSREKGLS